MSQRMAYCVGVLVKESLEDKINIIGSQEKIT